jgi:hypothetical protein
MIAAVDGNDGLTAGPMPSVLRIGLSEAWHDANSNRQAKTVFTVLAFGFRAALATVTRFACLAFGVTYNKWAIQGSNL